MRNNKGQFIKGSSGFSGPHTEETKKKIRIARARQGSNVWNKGLKNWNNGHFVSLETKRKISEAQRGDKNHQWRGGLTPLRIKINHSFKYRQWRSDIFQRDNYTCQICEARGGYLEVDHFPKTYSQILREYKIFSLGQADICEELWNINNGRTLCKNCHKKYGINPNRKN